MSTIEQYLQDRVAEIAGVAASSLSVSASLARLGMDSLQMIHLVESIERELETEVPGTLCLDRVSIASLAEALTARPGRPAGAPLSVAEQMAADCELPEDIRPAAGWTYAPPRSILLTGGTGFLGAFLLRSLLRNTEADVACLVRPNRQNSDTRIRRNLERYGLWQEGFEHRITSYEADISQPRLGLRPYLFDFLAHSVDVIFHGAASVNWVQSYARLRQTNVLAMRELLRLACLHKTKPFHLISSLAVCYSTTASGVISELDGVFRDVDGIHLGYAQSKCVAESLVTTASRRALPVSIFRPALISGDSVNGTSNTADIVSSLIKACVQMRAAPDLDWRLDLLPVDFAADAIARLALSPDAKQEGIFHLANPHMRHWRELVLWMNLFGYPIELMPYDEWLDAARRGNALRDLLPFFLHRPENQHGLYLPQLYEESRRRKVQFDATRDRLKQEGLRCPGLSAGLIDHYFQFYLDREFLPDVRASRRTERAVRQPEFDAAFFRSVIQDDVVNANALDCSSGSSVIGELTSWKYGRAIGIHAYRLEFPEPVRDCDVVVKVKPEDTQVIAVGQTVAALCSPRLGTAYERYSGHLGLTGCHTRELDIYQRGDAQFRRFTPAFYGGESKDGRVVVVLEKLSGLELMDSADHLDRWQPEHIEAAIEGIAQLHAGEYSKSRSQRRVVDAMDLWTALAENARPMFSAWIGPEIGSVQDRLLEQIDDFGRLEESLPHTRIHNDFNPRNLAFRRCHGELTLCAYDWELATLGLPQHDLAELLCFVLNPSLQSSEVLCYVEMHRVALQRATGQEIDEASWALGFALSLYDLMINRLPAYAMIHRFNEQRFLERVIRTWKGLFDVVSSAIHTTL